MGIPVENEIIRILLYADDIALVTENERDRQVVLDVLNKWCEKWRLNVNSAKSSYALPEVEFHDHQYSKLEMNNYNHLSNTSTWALFLARDLSILLQRMHLPKPV
ncbi:Hypothetical predicted protein, partial [Mytilus galloprovincialis]